MAEMFGLDILYRYRVADDDLDSLFGGGDDMDLASLFTEAAAIEPSREPDSPLFRRLGARSTGTSIDT